MKRRSNNSIHKSQRSKRNTSQSLSSKAMSKTRDILKNNVSSCKNNLKKNLSQFDRLLIQKKQDKYFVKRIRKNKTKD